MDPEAPKQQVLVTKSDFSADKYRLVELNDEVEEAFKAGDRVFIVGTPADRAVLCTSSKSFYLTKEDTSNLRLLTEHTEWKARDAAGESEAPAGKDEIVVRGSAKFHFLLQPKGHDAMRLKALLMESPYEQTRSSKHSSTPQKRAKLHKLYTTDELIATLQSSEQEVLDMLSQLHAFEDAGTWRLLSASYQSRVFGEMLDAIVQNDLDFLSSPGIPLAKFQEATEYPLVVIRQCCKIYGTLHADGAEETCTLEPSQIASFCAKQLFEEQSALSQESGGSDGDGWVLDQFMDKWMLRVPDKVSVSVEMLRGVGLMKTQRGKPTRIVYFPETDLPLDAKQRFERLFQVQEKWTVQQLEPFIQSLVVPGTTQAALLLKHTRSSRQFNSSERLYSRR